MSSLSNGTRYGFQVRALNSCESGFGPPSRLVEVTLPIRVPGDHTTISAAIRAARSGVTVLISSGTYNEALDMKSGVSLKKEGSGTVTVTPFIIYTTAALFSGDNDLTVEGLHFKGVDGDAVNINNSSNVTLKNCDFRTETSTSGDALYVSGASSSVTLDHCSFHSAQYGLHSNGAGAIATLGGSDFYDNGTYGVYITNHGNAELSGNNFSYPAPHNGTRDIHASFFVTHNIDATNSFWGYASDGSARSPVVHHEFFHFSILTSSASSSPRAKMTADRQSLARDRVKAARGLLLDGETASAQAAFREIFAEYGDLKEEAIAALQGLVTTASKLDQGRAQYARLLELVRTHLSPKIQEAALYFATGLLQHEREFATALTKMADFEHQYADSELLPYLLLDKALLLEYRGEEDDAVNLFKRLAVTYPSWPQAAKVRTRLQARGKSCRTAPRRTPRHRAPVCWRPRRRPTPSTPARRSDSSCPISPQARSR